VLRFLGRKVPKSTGQPRANFQGEVNSRLQCRVEGVRIRHALNGNSLKMYDKEGSVLRVETTIVQPKEFRIYRLRVPGARRDDGLSLVSFVIFCGCWYTRAERGQRCT
jgi:hypothetical protein